MQCSCSSLEGAADTGVCSQWRCGAREKFLGYEEAFLKDLKLHRECELATVKATTQASVLREQGVSTEKFLP